MPGGVAAGSRANKTRSLREAEGAPAGSPSVVGEVAIEETVQRTRQASGFGSLQSKCFSWGELLA